MPPLAYLQSRNQYAPKNGTFLASPERPHQSREGSWALAGRCAKIPRHARSQNPKNNAAELACARNIYKFLSFFGKPCLAASHDPNLAFGRRANPVWPSALRHTESGCRTGSKRHPYRNANLDKTASKRIFPGSGLDGQCLTPITRLGFGDPKGFPDTYNRLAGRPLAAGIGVQVIFLPLAIK